MQTNLSIFVSLYDNIANWKAVLDRLTTFQRAMSMAEASAAQPGLAVTPTDGEAIAADGASIALPDGRTLVRLEDAAFAPGEAVLISGPSGAGKTSLFDRRHLAVRLGRDRRSGRCQRDGAAAVRLPAARHAEGGACLSASGRDL